MKIIMLMLLASVLMNIHGCTQTKPGSDRMAGDGCEDCDKMLEGMPSNLTWTTRIAGPEEPGEPMTIRGTIYLPDRKTPASNVILYVYHTDHNGIYSPSPGQTNGRRHGHLRSWMKTDLQGRYQFTSIRPSSYPNRKDPEHVHAIVKEPGTSLYWIDDYLFEDDSKLTPGNRSKQQNRGGSGIIQLTKNETGVWIGHRDIILGMNIPNY